MAVKVRLRCWHGIALLQNIDDFLFQNIFGIISEQDIPGNVHLYNFGPCWNSGSIHCRLMIPFFPWWYHNFIPSNVNLSLTLRRRIHLIMPNSNIMRSNVLQWRHNERHCVSNHRRLDCLLNHLFGNIKENSKTPRHWRLWGESTGDRLILLTKGQ